MVSRGSKATTSQHRKYCRSCFGCAATKEPITRCRMDPWWTSTRSNNRVSLTWRTSSRASHWARSKHLQQAPNRAPVPTQPLLQVARSTSPMTRCLPSSKSANARDSSNSSSNTIPTGSASPLDSRSSSRHACKCHQPIGWIPSNCYSTSTLLTSMPSICVEPSGSSSPSFGLNA